MMALIKVNHLAPSAEIPIVAWVKRFNWCAPNNSRTGRGSWKTPIPVGSGSNLRSLVAGTRSVRSVFFTGTTNGPAERCRRPPTPSQGRGGLAEKPAIFPAGILAVGNSLEGEDIARNKASHFAVFRIGNRQLRRGAERRLLLVNSGFDAVRGVSRTNDPCSKPGASRKLQSVAPAQETRIIRV